MSSESEKLNVPSVFSATSFYTCMVLLLRLLLKLLDGNMFIPISCFCVCACVCVCVCASTLKHSSNSLTGHSDYITHSRWCRSSNMITNKAVCWVQIPQSQSSWMGRRSGREEEEGGGGAGLVGRCSRPNKELFIMIYSLHGDSSYFTGLSVAWGGLLTCLLNDTLCCQCQDVMLGCLACPPSNVTHTPNYIVWCQPVRIQIYIQISLTGSDTVKAGCTRSTLKKE